MMRPLYRDFAPDGAWCFFADPRAVYFAGNHRRTYVGWLTSQGDVMLGSYDHDRDTIDSCTIKPSLQRDDHANPALYVDRQGRITVFYSAHNGSAMYYRTTERAEDLSSFGAEHRLPVNSEGNKGYTYPNPVFLQKEQQLYLFWRGGNFKPCFSTCADLDKNRWSEAKTLILDNGQRPYIRYVSDGVETIHFACTDGHPNVEPHNSIYYGCYRNGMLYRADGTPIKRLAELPLSLAEIDTVFDGRAAGCNSWIWDIATDGDGYPVIVYVVFVSVTDHRYYYSRWNGERWNTHQITPGGSWFPQTRTGHTETEPYYSGGIILDHRNPAIVYLSRPVSGVFEIERWHTPDGGQTWSSAAVTARSSRHHVRPFLARGGGDPALLLWMHGDYVHYTDYRTAIRMTFV